MLRPLRRDVCWSASLEVGMRFPRFRSRLIHALVTSLVALTLAHTARAQPLHYGLRGGVNLANIRGDFADLINPDMKPGVAVGGFATVALAPMLALEMDALYVQKGFKVTGTAAGQSGDVVGVSDVRLELQYIDVPLVAKLSLPSWGGVSPYLVAGPSLGFGLSAKQKGFGATVDLSGLKDVILGGTAGGGVKLGAGPVAFGIEARYQTDFSDLWDIDDNAESINSGVAITGWVAR